MQAITIRQPWAWAIVQGAKDIENRSWNTRFRGTLAIHAGKGYDGFDGWPRGVDRCDRENLAFGAIIGVADIVDVVTRSRSKWYYPGNFGFVLKNARALKRPIACMGSLGVWKVPPRIVRAMRAQGLDVEPGGLRPRKDISSQ